MSENNQIDYKPEPVLRITDLETLRVMSEPLRQKIIERMIYQPQTVKQLASALKMPVTKLYYHINLLEEQGIIKVVSSRVVSGIIEKLYQSAAYSFSLDYKLLNFQQEEARSVLGNQLLSLFDLARDEITEGINSGVYTNEEKRKEFKLTIAREVAFMTREQAEAFSTRLEEMISEFAKNDQQQIAEGSQKYSILLAFYPVNKD